jgi:hypothetical protein
MNKTTIEMNDELRSLINNYPALRADIKRIDYIQEYTDCYEFVFDGRKCCANYQISKTTGELTRKSALRSEYGETYYNEHFAQFEMPVDEPMTEDEAIDAEYDWFEINYYDATKPVLRFTHYDVANVYANHLAETGEYNELIGVKRHGGKVERKQLACC